jgi:hypothetical protein
VGHDLYTGEVLASLAGAAQQGAAVISRCLCVNHIPTVLPATMSSQEVLVGGTLHR